MDNLVRYRAMESLCRQSAVFRPLDSWRLLAEAEMWHHKAEEEIDSRFRQCKDALSSGVLPTKRRLRTHTVEAKRSRAEVLAAHPR
jgi:hypothetical protein